jgi:hypothetical protein
LATMQFRDVVISCRDPIDAPRERPAYIIGDVPSGVRYEVGVVVRRGRKNEAGVAAGQLPVS